MSIVRLLPGGGTTSQVAAYTGLAREMVIDTTLWTLHIMDGSTAGGHQIGGMSALSQGSDVSISSPADGQLLMYHAATSKWINSGISLAWSAITSTPTTLAGYGITDGVTSSSLTSTLASYVTSSSLTTTLASYLTTSAASSTYLTQANAASTYAPLASPSITGTAKIANLVAGGATSITSAFYSGSGFGALVGTSGLGGAGAFAVYRWNTGNPATVIIGSSQSGTINSFAALAANVQFGRISFAGDNGAGLEVGANIIATTSSTGGTWSSTNGGTALTFQVSPDASTTPGTILTLSGNGTSTFVGTVTIPTLSVSTSATIPGYLTTATAASTYAPLASPTFTGTAAHAAATFSGTVSGAGITSLLAPYATLASPTFTGTVTVPSGNGATPVGYRGAPQRVSSSSTTLVVGDAGGSVVMTSGTASTVTIPASTFSAGDIVTVIAFNGTVVTSITAGTGMTMYATPGTATTSSTVTLTSVGIATIYFHSASDCVVMRSNT